MGSRKKSDFFRAQSFTQSLRALVESLPSESEKQQITSDLDTVINFLNEVKQRVASLPSREGAGNVRSAVDSLDALFARARESAPLAAALGVRPAGRRVRPQPLTEVDSERAKTLLGQMEKLPMDEVRARLENASETGPRDLQAIAAVMGIRATQRSNRETLVHQIASKIANIRGYETLRRGSDETEQGQG